MPVALQVASGRTLCRRGQFFPQLPIALPLGRLLLSLAGLSKLILFGERSMRQALGEFVEHFHTERNHQAKGSRLAG